MPISCSAVNCANRCTKSSGVTFHNFPVKNEVLCNKWLVAMRRTTWKPSTTSKLCSKHFKPSCFRTVSGKTSLIEGSVPSVFEFPELVRKKSPSKRASPRKRCSSPSDNNNVQYSTSNSTDVTLQITSDHNYCPPSFTKLNSSPTTAPTNVKLRIRTDDHNYCPTTFTKLITKPVSANSTNVKLRIRSDVPSSDHNYCPPNPSKLLTKPPPSSSTAVTLRIRSDGSFPDHNYHCPQPPSKLVKRLKMYEDRCLLLNKKLKVARQKIRRQNAKIVCLQKTIAGLAQRLCSDNEIQVQNADSMD